MVELLISAAIGLLVMLGLLKVFFFTTQSWRYLNTRVTVTNNLSLVQNELLKFSLSCEPDFWRKYPRRSDLIHAGTTARNAVDMGHECALYPETDCLITWDIKPSLDEPVTYRLGGDVGDTRILVEPHDREFPVGPMPGVGPMSVFLLVSPQESFPVLVTDVQSPRIILCDFNQQPWVTPEHFNPSNYQGIHLGRLEVTHHTRAPEEGWTGVLIRHQYTQSGSEWERHRGVSSFTHLKRLLWSPVADHPQLLLIGQSAQAPLGSGVRWIGEHMFHKEAQVVGMSF